MNKLFSYLKSHFAKQKHPVIPSENIANNSLLVAIAIMTFLSSTSICSLYLLNKSITNWNQKIASQISIEITPRAKHNIEKDLEYASQIALTFPGVCDANIMEEAEIKKLLEPWFGKNFAYEDIDLPRIIIIHLTEKAGFDYEKFDSYLKSQLPNAQINSHQNWIKQLQAMANKCYYIVLIMLILLSYTLMITVIFATRNAVSANLETINVLHLIGANREYIIKQFDSVFFNKAYKGSILGACCSVALFSSLAIINIYYYKSYSSLASLFSDFHLSWGCYKELILLICFVIILTITSSRIIISKQLHKLEFDA